MFTKRAFVLSFPLVLWLVAALVMLVAADPLALDLNVILKAPDAQHLLGTDELGRDVLSRLVHGVQVSFTVGLCVLLLAGSIGVIVGVVSGWFGGWIDAVLMRITDIFLSFPGILIAICFAALAGPDIKNVIYALGLMGWVSFARLARVQTLKIKNEDYVQAALLNGTPVFAIFAVHLVPNIAAPLIVESAFTVAGAMLSEAGLSFLGIGIQAPAPSLGSMLREGARYLLVAPHLVVVPGATLMCIVLSLNLAGEKIRDTLDAKEN